MIKAEMSDAGSLPLRSHLVVREYEPPANTIFAGGGYFVSAVIVEARTEDEAVQKGQSKRSSNDNYCSWSAYPLSELNEFCDLGSVGWNE